MSFQSTNIRWNKHKTVQAVDSKSSIFYRNISYAFHALPMLLLLLRNFITISTTYLLVDKYLPLLQPSHSSERDKINFHWDNCPYTSHSGPLALGNSGLNPPSLLATIGGCRLPCSDMANSTNHSNRSGSHYRGHRCLCLLAKGYAQPHSVLFAAR